MPWAAVGTVVVERPRVEVTPEAPSTGSEKAGWWLQRGGQVPPAEAPFPI